MLIMRLSNNSSGYTSQARQVAVGSEGVPAASQTRLPPDKEKLMIPSLVPAPTIYAMLS